MTLARRYPVGAELTAEGAHFRVWAPRRERVEVVLEGVPRGAAAAHALVREDGGYFAGLAPGAAAGARYRFRLDGEPSLYPDPASRFQPEGPHGPSEVVDPSAYRWRDQGWPGVRREGHVIYEVHVGTLTREGTWAAASEELPRLADLGVTLLEVMPIADFPGAFGWGYDGVNLWAPTRLYGSPYDLRRFIDAAHAAGVGVILDVVYNHFGPDGNYMKPFSPAYFTDRHRNDWGEAINFDGEDAGPVREFFITNAAYWIDEYHFDGLRLDATQSIQDTSAEHVIAALTRRAREAAGRRAIYVVAENEPQAIRIVRPRHEGGYGVDALWNDDFHHAAMVALTGRHEAYYNDYRGRPQEFISAAKWGFLYQGQRYQWQKQPRGTPSLGTPASSFVAFLQNHDQVANSLLGARIHHLTSPGRLRAMTALLLLGPATPMLFQGQELGTPRPFLYFADHNPELARLVTAGRGEFLSQFPSMATEEAQRMVPEPSSPETFTRCKLDSSESTRNAAIYSLHRDLIRLRASEPAFAAQRADSLHGAVLSDEAFVLRHALGGDEDRVILVNLGGDLHLDPAPEPLLAPPADCTWEVLWSSESVHYGGQGIGPIYGEASWYIPAHAAIVLHPRSRAVIDTPPGATEEP
jgi:maltooligosyltrehalose trehalohydrolase